MVRRCLINVVRQEELAGKGGRLIPAEEGGEADSGRGQWMPGGWGQEGQEL